MRPSRRPGRRPRLVLDSVRPDQVGLSNAHRNRCHEPICDRRHHHAQRSSGAGNASRGLGPDERGNRGRGDDHGLGDGPVEQRRHQLHGLDRLRLDGHGRDVPRCRATRRLHVRLRRQRDQAVHSRLRERRHPDDHGHGLLPPLHHRQHRDARLVRAAFRHPGSGSTGRCVYELLGDRHERERNAGPNLQRHRPIHQHRRERRPARRRQRRARPGDLYRGILGVRRIRPEVPGGRSQDAHRNR